MSLAGIIAGSLDKEGITFKKAGKKISSRDVAEILKDIIAKRLLTFSQGGGIGNKEYFCDKCAKNLKMG